MSTSPTWMFCGLWALLLCSEIPRLLAQGASGQNRPCFSIHVRLNGKPIEGPQVITLKTKQAEATPSLETGCFRVPPAILAEKAVDIAFTVPGNKVSLWSIPTGFLAGSWDIDLSDKKFGKDIVLPKHARAKEACAVVFHVGEPERALLQTGCRTRVSDSAAKTRASSSAQEDKR